VIGGISTARLGRLSGTTRVLLLVIAAGWAFSVWAEASGAAAQLHHHALYHGALPSWLALLLVLGSWQAMTAAMMLPSSLPLALLYSRMARNAPRYSASISLFLAAYFAVWTAFALVAFGGDMLLHRLVHASQWLTAHDQVVAAGTLGLAGSFQLTPFKDACLRTCRHPAVYLMRHYRRGPAAGAALGLEHGLFCVGCCWALMLVMFAVGVAHLAWMGALALVMFVEKATPRGRRLVGPIAIALLALAAMALVVPGSVPGL
jgi:predicted metal-binding membrane protein